MCEFNKNYFNYVNQNHFSSPVVRLRAATYLAPSIPIEYFEIVLDYLKTRLGYIDTSLRYESNCANVESLFEGNEINMAWVNQTNLIRLSQEGKASQLPVGSVHTHSIADDRSGYYSDVIIRKSFGIHVKKFEDLRGCKWVYSSNETLNNVLTLNELSKRGENASFFGMCQTSSSHLQSIHMVLNCQSDATAIDSNCLQIFLDRNPKYRNELSVLTSFGPLPSYPIVVNNNMSVELRREIVSALLDMHSDKWYSKILSKYKVKKFVKLYPWARGSNGQAHDHYTRRLTQTMSK